MIDIYDFMDALLCSDHDTIGTLVNDVGDEFRRGRNLRDLLPLLTHSDARFIGVGAWIVSEVADSVRGREIYPQLCSLLSHADPAVRFEAVKSVACLVQPNEKSVIQLLLRRLIDEDPGVRRQALTQVCLLPDAVLEGMQHTSEWAEVQLLIEGATKDQIKLAASSGGLLAQRLAVAAAMRNYGNDFEFIEELVRDLNDNEIKDKIAALPKGRRFA